MTEAEIVERTKNFKDSLGFSPVGDIKTKADCERVLVDHIRWIKNASTDAVRSVDNFIREMGLFTENKS